MTANPKWSEIQNHLSSWETAADRPDLVARVFKLKAKQLMHEVTKVGVFGKVLGWAYVIEFQVQLPASHLIYLPVHR